MEQFMASQMDKSKAKPSIVSSSQIIKLISSDNHTFFKSYFIKIHMNILFYVNKDVICISKHLGNLISSGFKEGESKEIRLDISAEILEVCVKYQFKLYVFNLNLQFQKYLHYKLIYRKVNFQRPAFDIAPEKALDVLKAAIYLQC